MFHSGPQRDPTPTRQLFLSLPLDEARSAAARIAAATLANDGDGLEVDDETELRRLRGELAEVAGASPDDVSPLLSAVLGTAGMLSYADWHEAGTARPEKPAVSRRSLEGALLIHLHGSPDGPPAQVVWEEYRDHADVYPRGLRPTLAGADRIRDYVRAHRDRASRLQAYLRGIRG